MLKIDKNIEMDVNEYVEAARALEKEHGAGSFTVRAVEGGVRVWRTTRTPRVRKAKATK